MSVADTLARIKAAQSTDTIEIEGSDGQRYPFPVRMLTVGESMAVSDLPEKEQGIAMLAMALSVGETVTTQDVQDFPLWVLEPLMKGLNQFMGVTEPEEAQQTPASQMSAQEATEPVPFKPEGYGQGPVAVGDAGNPLGNH